VHCKTPHKATFGSPFFLVFPVIRGITKNDRFGPLIRQFDQYAREVLSDARVTDQIGSLSSAVEWQGVLKVAG